MASTRISNSVVGAQHNSMKMAPQRESYKSNSQTQIFNPRKPLQSIDANLAAATRVQPSRQAKRKQQKAFDIFEDEENKRAPSSKQVQQLNKTNQTHSSVSTTSFAAPSASSDVPFAAPSASSAATALTCRSIAASSLISGSKFSAVPAVDASLEVASAPRPQQNDTIGRPT